MSTRLSAILVFVALPWLAVACGPPCKSNKARYAKLTAERVPAPEAHALMLVPFDLINSLIETELAELAPQVLPLTDLPGLVPKVSVVVSDVKIVPAADGLVGLVAKVGFVMDEEELLSLDLATELAPALVGPQDKRSLVIPMQADALKSLRPVLSEGATEKLADAIHKKLPSIIRGSTPKAVSRLAAGRLLSALSERGYALVRDLVLRRLGKVTELRFRLPEMPVEKAVVSTQSRGQHQALQIAMHTALPVREGVGSALALDPDLITVAMSGSAAAELANWAIASGVAPSRFTRGLKPDKKGLYYPHFDWTGDAAPMQVHMFRRGDWCAYIHASLLPKVEIKTTKEGERLLLTAANRRLEQYQGPVHLMIGVWLKSLWWYIADSNKTVPAEAQVSIGPRQLRTRLAAVDIGAKVLSAQLHVDLSSVDGSAEH